MPANGERRSRLLCRSGTSSSLRILRTKSPEATKLTASTSTAIGAFSAWISAPASAGPASWAPDLEISSFEFPSTS